MPADNRFTPIRILSIETEGFSYLPRQEIILHESITGAIGENGSGKTTFLNLLRVLLGAIRFDNDHSLKTFFERDDIYDIYVVGKFDNSLQIKYGKQPFDTIGKYKDIVSVICRLQLDQLNVKTTYLIYDGEFNLEEDLKYSHRWLEPKQYRKQMEEVGLSRALINSFSLSQGNTEEILKKSEEELADYLLQICGEHERITKFQLIKSDVKKQKEQYTYLLDQKGIEEAQTKHLQERIERCKKIIENEDVLAQLSFELPIARYVVGRNELNDYKYKVIELEGELNQICIQIQNCEDEKSYIENEYTDLDKIYKRVQSRNRNYQEKCNKVFKILYRIQSQIAGIEEFLNTYKKITPIPEDILEIERKSGEESYSNALTELRTSENYKLSLEENIFDLESKGTIILPPDVDKMSKILSSNEIEFLLVADCVEINDEEWREAIEALFGPERFTIAVSDKNIVQVMKWAQDIKYPYWISPFKESKLKIQKNSVLEKVNILDHRITGYLENFKDYFISKTVEEAWGWVTKGKCALLNKPNPYKVIPRGGRFIKSNGKYCGKLAYKLQLEEYKKELGKILPVFKSLEKKVQDQRLILNETMRQIDEQKSVKMVPKKELELQSFSEREKRASTVYNAIKKILSDTEQKREEMEGLRKTLFSKSNVLELSLRQHKEKYDEKNNQIKKVNNYLSNSQDNLSMIEGSLTDGHKKQLTDQAFVSNIKPVDYYVGESDKLRAIVIELRNISSSENIEPGEEKRMVSLEQKYRHHQSILKQHIEEIERVRLELEQLEEKHKIVQEEYHLMVEEVFSKVRHSLNELSSIAKIEADLRAFYIGEDRWKVDYRIGFHGKKPQSYQVKTGLSGGQKVIASLLLTLAAIKSDGNLSFMILDEPFAHLDHERINQAGEFLKSTGVQFIIAMPYSENVKLFMPWVDMILNFRPKSITENVAPPITYGVINNDYLAQRKIV